MSVDGERVVAAAAGKLLHRNVVPVIGDYVDVQPVGEGKVIIQDVRERKSCLSRPDGRGHADSFVKTVLEQPMAANLDYLFIITSLNDNFNVNRIARFAAAAVKGGCRPVVILTKADLCPDRETFLESVHRLNGSMDAICVSAHTGEGLDELRSRYLRPGITIGLMGSSGVGKSTLVNTLAGREVMRVSGIREKDDKGRHTTTHRELLDIDGTFFIDTPGMREFGLCDVEEGINETFDDVARLTEGCRFSDCSHRSEPGCAVRAALEDGSLSEERWRLYCSLQEESSRKRALLRKKEIAVRKRKAGK